MPVTATKQTLLWQSITWVQYEYSNQAVENQVLRPQRCYQLGDGKRISSLIKKIKQAYHTQKKEVGKDARFDVCKKETLLKQATSPTWDESTRNFYSSVISVYFSWSHHGIPKHIDQQLLESLTLLTAYIQNIKQCT